MDPMSISIGRFGERSLIARGRRPPRVRRETSEVTARSGTAYVTRTAIDPRTRSFCCYAGDLLPYCWQVCRCRNEAVFIRATLELPVAAASAIERLDAALARHRLDEVSDDAYAAGLVVLTRVGPFGEIAGLSKTVRLELLTPRQVDRGIRLQLRWVATGATGQLFPALDADLDLLAVDEQHCALSINAVYDPPLGALGAGIDRILLHRAARATVRALLRELGHTLTEMRQLDGSVAVGRLRLGPVRFTSVEA
jgi:hypothetical protein